MDSDLHPHALVLAEFFYRRLGRESKALTRILSDLIQAQEDGHVCLTLKESQRRLLEKFPELYLPKGGAPLVLEEERLYFRRLWQYEERLVQGIVRLKDSQPLSVDEDKLELLARAASLDPSQRAAIVGAAAMRFAILTGGPGTGKTTTVLQLIALRSWQQPDLKVALAAPTGKAAQRLTETLKQRIDALPLPETLKSHLPREVTTLHHLLGARPGTSQIRYQADRPLPYDLVVVDEASMVDLALAAKLVDALPEGGNLLLVGDRDQLASVEAGSILADLCDGASEHTFRLTTVHRFQSELAELAAAVKEDDAKVLKLLPRLEDIQALWQAIDEGYRSYWQAVREGGSFREVHAAFARFRVLCAHRRGPLGSDWLNQELEARWRRHGWVAGGKFYPGRALLIQENVPDLGLFNGDIGICLADEGGVLKVWLEDGRRFSPARLPACETVFAMTVHKAQGSEFEGVLLVLPLKPSEVLSRELIYTALTRARKEVECFGPETVLRVALSRCIQRQGGLRRKLLEPHADRFAAL